MLAVSSNAEFNTALNELKSKSKKMDIEKGPSYSFDGTTAKKAKDFVAKMKRSGAYGDEAPEQKKDDDE